MPCPVQTSQLFDGARQRFLDALLAAARVEVYLPNVRPAAAAGSDWPACCHVWFSCSCPQLSLHVGPPATVHCHTHLPPCQSTCLPTHPPTHPPVPLQVELLSEGDSVNELFVVVSGSLTSYRVTSLFDSEVKPNSAEQWAGSTECSHDAWHGVACIGCWCRLALPLPCLCPAFALPLPCLCPALRPVGAKVPADQPPIHPPAQSLTIHLLNG